MSTATTATAASTTTRATTAKTNWITGRDWRGWVLPAALIATWWLVTAQGWVNTKLIVPPGSVLQTAIKTLADYSFYEGVVLSLGRDLSGLFIGALGGVALGTLLAISRWADRLIGPTFHTVRQVSLFAWLPMLTSWLGYGDLSKIVFIALSAFYPVVLGTFEGVKGVTQAHAEVAKIYGFSRTQVLFRLILPAASPQILTGLNLGLVYAWLATIGSEFLLANWGNGLGNIVFKGRAAFNVELIIVGMLAIGLVGTFFNQLATRLEQHALRWRGPRA